MGISVYFSRGSRDGALSHFLSAPLRDFRAWYVQQYAEGYYSFTDPDFLALLDAVIEQGAAALQPTTQEQAKLMDLVVDGFYAWCEWERKELLGEPLSRAVRSSYYCQIASEIKKQGGDNAERLWNYIRTGRAIGRGESAFPYTPPDPSLPNAFWTYKEVALLYHRLKRFKASFADTFGENGGAAAESAFAAVEVANAEGIGLIIEVD